jgi:hypothetical protein
MIFGVQVGPKGADFNNFLTFYPQGLKVEIYQHHILG